ncbi:hypothetical protein TNCV_3899701 [Trichonephila clavipes]|nr:hypothetical protein TNCV_3899701 [Trichonephila clavipes]
MGSWLVFLTYLLHIELAKEVVKTSHNPYSKRESCMQWTKIPVPVYGHLPLETKDLEQLSIVYWTARVLFPFYAQRV